MNPIRKKLPAFTPVFYTKNTQTDKDWRASAWRLVMLCAHRVGCPVSGEEVEDMLLRCEESYHYPNNLNKLPQSIQDIITSVLDLVVAVRLEQLPNRRPFIQTPKDVLLLFGNMIYQEQEVFKVLFLDEKNRLLFSYNAAVGGVNRVWVEPRYILREALEWNARKMVILHNHPSGNLEPGEEDIAFTRKIERGCSCIGIRLLDHLILGRKGKKYFSFAEKKLVLV